MFFSRCRGLCACKIPANPAAETDQAPRKGQQMGVVDIMRRCRIGLALTSAVLAMLATLSSGGLGAVSAQTAIHFSLDSKFEGQVAPFTVAVDKGYFKAEKLDVSIETGANAIEPITRVASGNFDMGFADINALIRFRNANPDKPVKAVFMVYNKPPYAIISRKSRGVEKPKDLEGKKLGAPVADPAFAQWKIFAQVNKIDTSKVMIENIGIPVRGPMLAAGQVDAITGLTFSTYVNLKERGVPVNDIVVLLMADYGVKLYGNAIIVNPKFAAEKPQAVKAFLRALLRALKDTVRNPASAVNSVVSRNELAGKSVELERLRTAIGQNILTDEVKANGYGTIDTMRFQAAIDQLALTIPFKTKPKPGDIFDDAFLPAAAERRVR
jgi:NitT/TauT family transport system substrate-binding protein